MSAAYDAEERDQEAAERLRVHEWAAEHQNPLTAALQRAETAERRAATAESLLAASEALDVTVNLSLDRPSTCVVKHHGVVIFDGVSRDALISKSALNNAGKR